MPKYREPEPEPTTDTPEQEEEEDNAPNYDGQFGKKNTKVHSFYKQCLHK